ncbi:MAG: UvrD-helicase domain-containing protein, partial [Thermoanaerobaculia bacterium]
ATASEVLIERLRARQPQIAALVHEAVAPAQLHASLVDLVAGGARKEDFATDPFDDRTCAAILERVAVPLARFLPELERLALLAKRLKKTLPPAVEALRQLEAAFDLADRNRAGLQSAIEQARASSAAWQELLARYAEGELKVSEEDELGAERECFLALALSANDRLVELLAFDLRRFELARQALGSLVEQVRYRLDRAGVLTFDDLLDRAADLLQRNSAVRRKLRREIRQLLVDEFQDTDRRQCELLAALALGEEEGARPGLFIVGDPKQSIYAWRKADLASYEDFLARMQQAGGTSARLSVNFRSVPAVLTEVARTIAPVMIAEPSVQPRFEPLSSGPALAASSGFDLRDRHPVEYWLSWDAVDFSSGRPTKTARANTVEAAAIAADIRDLHDVADKAWGSFAILLRSRKGLEVYLEALRRAGVPYAVQRDRSYYRRREIIDLACAVRAVLDPADLLALVAFLRSPLVGVPDAAWIPLWRSGFAAAMTELENPQGIATVARTITIAVAETPAAIPGLARLGDWPLALAEAVRTVARLRAEFRQLPVASWIERLRAWLLPEPLAAARFLGRFGLANVERMLSRLERELGEESDPHRALTRLQRAVEEEKDAEDARPPDASSDAVAVMTIHTAKGLEFDQVFLAQSHRGSRSDSSVLDAGKSEIVDRAEPVTPSDPADPVTGRGVPAGRARELLLFGAPSPGFLAVERLRRRARSAETVRLLYVALTRARERLVICGNWSPAPKAFDPGRAKTFIDLMAGRAPGNLSGLAADTEVFDADNVPWRFAARRIPSPAAMVGARAGEVGEPVGASLTDLPPRAVSAVERGAARARGNQLRLERAAGLVVAGESLDDEAGAPGEAASRSLALALGVASHRALELEELAESSPADWRSAAEAAFLGELPGASSGDRRRLHSELDLLAASPLLARLRALRPAVLARELPLLTGAAGSTALDGVVGTLDLLYRDPASGETVVADFKTDEMEPEAATAVAGKVARYRPQLELYGRAVQQALGLDRAPRLELWLLRADRIEVVS